MLDVRCPEYLEEVRAFARTLKLEDQLQKQLDYLSYYGWAGTPKNELPPEDKQNICVLRKDFAPHSFEFAVFCRDANSPDGRKYMVNGGLIFQGPANPANGGFPSLTVSLAEGTGWFVHT